MHYVKSFKELEVYKISRELSKSIFTISQKFPSDEKYSLTDQIRRSSRSIGAQLAEAWGKKNMRSISSQNYPMLIPNNSKHNTGLKLPMNVTI
jgi:hypothetical protein